MCIKGCGDRNAGPYFPARLDDLGFFGIDSRISLAFTFIYVFIIFRDCYQALSSATSHERRVSILGGKIKRLPLLADHNIFPRELRTFFFLRAFMGDPDQEWEVDDVSYTLHAHTTVRSITPVQVIVKPIKDFDCSAR